MMDGHITAGPKPPASQPSASRLRGSCDRCQEAKLKCARNQPTCARCASHNYDCVYSLYRRVGRPRKAAQAAAQNGEISTASVSNPTHPTPEVSPTYTKPQNSLSPSSNQVFDFGNYMDSDDPGMGVQDMSYPNTMFLDTYEWVGEELTQPDNMRNDNMLSFLDPQIVGTPNAPAIPEFSFASVFSNNTVGKVPLVQRVIGETTLANLTHAQRIGSPSGLDTMMGYAEQTPSQTSSSFSSSYSAMVRSPSIPHISTCQNHCLQLISRQLDVLASQAHQGITMEKMLAMERVLAPINKATYSCSACTDSLVVMVMLTMLIEQTVVLFEKLSDCRHLSSSETFDSAQMSEIEWSLKKTDVDTRAGGREITSKSALLLGQYEVDKADKSDFLLKVVRLRLNRTASLLLQLQERVDRSSLRDCNAIAARSIGDNAYSRTEVLLGMLEIWKLPR